MAKYEVSADFSVTGVVKAENEQEAREKIEHYARVEYDKRVLKNPSVYSQVEIHGKVRE